MSEEKDKMMVLEEKIKTLKVFRGNYRGKDKKDKKYIKYRKLPILFIHYILMRLNPFNPELPAKPKFFVGRKKDMG